MATALHSKLGEGVNLPPDLIPDGNYSDDSDDEMASDAKEFKHSVELALAYYNDKHHTNYNKIVNYPEGRRGWHKCCYYTHIVFSAAEIATGACEMSSMKLISFFSVLNDDDPPEIVISSCIIADGLQSVGCTTCDGFIRPEYDPVTAWHCQRMKWELQNARKFNELFSQYAHSLVDGVNWTEKDIDRLEYSLSALTYYNRKQGKDYKLVDVLPYCVSIYRAFVIHCNFIARQNGPTNDTSNKLFFAELNIGTKRVTACRILHGYKTTAGCYNCYSRKGRRVVHPTRGFRHGLHAPRRSQRLFSR